MLPAALSYIESGLSVIPTDKASKRPKLDSWAAYQKVLPTADDARQWFLNGSCIAVIGGVVSGNLEIIDFDDPKIAAKWAELLKSWNCAPLLERCVIERSQRGGHHVAYRHKGPPEGNQKLAQRPTTEEERAENPKQLVKCKIETRGEGGYCIVAPSDGYKLKRGQWTELPVLSAEEREALLSAARTFDEMPRQHVSRNSGRVGDDYNARASIDEILIPLGWQRARGDKWTRPGKSTREGWSASWDFQGNKHFVVFTTSAGIEPGAYDLFGLYARLHFSGDFKAATLAASKAGYGEAPRQTVHRVTQVDHSDNASRKWLTFDEIQLEEVNWLAYPYLPLGIGYVLLFGDSGEGKSTSCLSLVSSFSNGIHPITKEQIDPIRSIVLSAEDSAQHVVKPRLVGFGANLKNIMAPEEFLEDGTPNPLHLDEEGVEALRQKVREFGARIVVIDPLTAYFTGQSLNDRLEARSWAKRIHNIAVTENCCPIIVHHVNKASGMQGRYRAAGSQDFFDGSRSALMAVRAGADSDDYALVHEKHNYSPKGESLGYTFSPETGFEWTGTSDLTSESAQAAFEEHVSPKKADACKDWILEQLERGPMLSEDLKKGAKLEGWSYATFRRAKDSVRDQVRSWKPGPSDPWWCEMRLIATMEDPYAD